MNWSALRAQHAGAEPPARDGRPGVIPGGAICRPAPSRPSWWGCLGWASPGATWLLGASCGRQGDCLGGGQAPGRWRDAMA